MELTSLQHTWILDLDGTLVKHNGYKIDGKDTLLHGVHEFLDSIPENDYVIILTARLERYKEETIRFLQENRVKFDKILFEIPVGERVIINDNKPSGIEMGKVYNKKRDSCNFPQVNINENL